MTLQPLKSGPPGVPRLILAHGAGAPMTSPFMEEIANLLAARSVATSRFEFGYMTARRATGKRRPPPKAESLTDEFRDILCAIDCDRKVFIGGKSLGGRVASLIADEQFARGRIAGLVCLGYPFHPPGKPAQLRTSHLEKLQCPALIVQGERDPFGSREEVVQFPLSGSISLRWISDGDHDFGPRGGSGTTRKANLSDAADAVAAFVAVHLR